MNRTKAAFVYGFAIFAAFFGAGNLILPPYLGFQSGPDWWLSTVGFLITATIIPLVALLVHARLQGTMLDFGNKVSNRFSLVLSILIYVIAIVLPCPRTAAVTHEMAIAPFFDSSRLLTSTVYFTLAMGFALYRGKVMDLVGKFLTPVIGLLLLVLIGLRFLSDSTAGSVGKYENPLISGFLEGYQTYDALAGLLMGGILVISIQNSQKGKSYDEKRKTITGASVIAMFGLFLIYAGLIYSGSTLGSAADPETNRTGLLMLLAESSMGSHAAALLGLLVALACFTTAVSLLVGTGDFFMGLLGDSQRVYRITVIVCGLLGILIGQWDVSNIISVAVPILMLVYPVVICLILLNILPASLAPQTVFRAVVLAALVFSVPDLLEAIRPGLLPETYHGLVPLSKAGLGWLLPSLLTFLGTTAYLRLSGR